VADERDPEPLEQMAKGFGCLGAVGRDNASVLAGDGERLWRPAARPRIVEEQRDSDRRLRREP
jgi:hypothetical protein